MESDNEQGSPLITADTLETSFEHARQADLCLAMGSSLTVTPAADIPEVHSRLVASFPDSTPKHAPPRRWASEVSDW